MSGTGEGEDEERMNSREGLKGWKREQVSEGIKKGDPGGPGRGAEAEG